MLGLHQIRPGIDAGHRADLNTAGGSEIVGLVLYLAVGPANVAAVRTYPCLKSGCSFGFKATAIVANAGGGAATLPFALSTADLSEKFISMYRA